MPRFAYSIASDLVAAFKLPFVSDASIDGMPAIAWSSGLCPLSSMGNPSTFTVWLSRQKPRGRIPREDREAATSFATQRGLTIGHHFQQWTGDFRIRSGFRAGNTIKEE